VYLEDLFILFFSRFFVFDFGLFCEKVLIEWKVIWLVGVVGVCFVWVCVF